jgi:pimeloyl-ACP methyl ester carboxylesterase
MPAVFVHGVPDTPHVWRKVLACLGRPDTVTLALPGFAAPRPPAFVPTKEGYVEWLRAELAKQPGPLDVVGHDWGALLVLRVLSLEPRLVRRWAVGGAPLDPEYVWHKTAQVWQTPGAGEQLMASMTPEALQHGLAASGVPADDAAETARRVDPSMKECILALYRSAIHVGREWTDDLARITAPGLVLWGQNNPYAAVDFGARLAARTAARFVAFEGCGHWWQLERPDEVAAELRTAGLGSR